MIRVSEKVTIEEVKQWDSGDVITIEAGTGAGKSYFVKNILYAFAESKDKKILFLIHRRNCVNQFLKEIRKDNKNDVIKIKTYQSLEKLYLNHDFFDFSEYEYIVCDEFHYFMSDAAFNKTTDMSLNAILSQKNKVKIFMSATGEAMKRYLNNKKEIKSIDYQIPTTYDFIEELTFFNKNETLEKFIEESISKNNKAIFFIQSAKEAYGLYKKYEKHCLFNCSNNNSEYYQFVDKNKINNMLEYEKFEELILITTTCMDSGVNIIDGDLKHIICDVKDIGTLIQCIGRKRIQNENDKVYIYIKTITNRQLGGMETQLKKKIKMADYFRTHTVDEYIKKYYREYDKSHMIYDASIGEDDKCTKKLNELMYFKCKIDIAMIYLMKQRGDFGYCKFLSQKFGFGNDYRLIDENYKKDDLESYLESIVGVKLYKVEQKILIEKIDLRDCRSRVQKSYEQFNTYFKANKMPYIIIPKQTSKIIDGKKKNFRYWEIINQVEI